VVRAVSGVVLSVLCICHILRVLARLFKRAIVIIVLLSGEIWDALDATRGVSVQGFFMLDCVDGLPRADGELLSEAFAFHFLVCVRNEGSTWFYGFVGLGNVVRLFHYMGGGYERQQATCGSSTPSSNNDSLVSRGFVNIGFCL